MEQTLLQKIVSFFSGKKVYLLAAGVVVVGVVEGNGWFDVPGITVPQDAWLEWVFTGAGLAAFRAALTKIGINW